MVGRRERDEREEGRKELHFIAMFFMRSLNKGALKLPNGDVLGSLRGCITVWPFSEGDS